MVDFEKLTQHLSELVQIPTVSDFDPAKEDEKAFETCLDRIRETYPVLYEQADFRRIGRRGLLFSIAGRLSSPAEGAEDTAEADDAGLSAAGQSVAGQSAAGQSAAGLKGPAVLMAHYDVVPVNEADWEEPPFSGVIKDGCLWGRGSLDTKGTLVCILENVSEALKEGWRPHKDLYLAFSGEEEVEGRSSDEIVSYLKEKGVEPAFVLDEGGAVIPEGLPGVKQRAVMIGIAEKGVANVKATIKGAGGHASTPPKHTLLGRMAKAACAVEKHQFRAQITPATKAMFKVIGRQKGGAVGCAFRHIDLFKPGVAPAASYLGGTFNAMVRSTAAVTMMEGSPSFNVLPGEVSMGINLRLLGTDTMESACRELEKAVNDAGIEFSVVSGSDPSPVSKVGGRAWHYLVKTAAAVWPDAIAAPYTLNGGTDSRFWHRISSHVYKLTPMVMTKEERGTVHGANEKIRLEALKEMADFYGRLIRGL